MPLIWIDEQETCDGCYFISDVKSDLWLGYECCYLLDQELKHDTSEGVDENCPLKGDS